MHRAPIDEAFLKKENTDVTRRLRRQGEHLNSLLRGAHKPTEGGHLEHLVREELRRHLPDRYRVSTGFIAAVDEDESPGDVDWQREVSHQFDVLVWDAHDYPALFEVGELAVILPASCAAVLEVTAKLDKAKILKDMAKLDDVTWFYRSRAVNAVYPYTALVGFKGLTPQTVLGHLELFYHQRSSWPCPWRYRGTRFANTWSWLAREHLPFFLNSVCVLDQGFVRGSWVFDSFQDADVLGWVRYDSYAHVSEDDLEDSFGLLKRELARWFFLRHLRPAAPEDADIHREFAFRPLRSPDRSIWIEDWERLLPCRNVTETLVGQKPPTLDSYPSTFVGVDHTEAIPTLFSDELEMIERTIERIDDQTWAVGEWKDHRRTGEWLVVKRFDSSNKPNWVHARVAFDGDAVVDLDGERHGDRDDFVQLLPTLLTKPRNS